MNLELQIIGTVHSEFPEKFGVPKQPGLVPELKAVIEMAPPFSHETFFQGLESCSHIWVMFSFHLNSTLSGATVRPPVLGGEKRVGVFATRSPHRPNPVGLSLVKLERIENKNGITKLHIAGHDFVDGTPVLDLKPYVASYDNPGESTHWSDRLRPAPLKVKWSEKALRLLEELGSDSDKAAVEKVLTLDPRPRSAKAKGSFGMHFKNLNVIFEGTPDEIEITNVELKKSL